VTLTEGLREKFPDVGEWEDRGAGLYRAAGWWHYRYVLIVGALNAVVAGEVVTQPPAWASICVGGAVRGADIDTPGMEAEVRRRLGQDIEYQRLPTCVVPGCTEKAPYRFKVAERGNLAGRYWVPGEEIRTCPDHGHDIYAAQGAYGRDRLAEWLRPDAKLDPLDAFDAGTDLLHGHEIAQARARMLRVAVPAAGQGARPDLDRSAS
jgi:hypothetical protein